MYRTGCSATLFTANDNFFGIFCAVNVYKTLQGGKITFFRAAHESNAGFGENAFPSDKIYS